MSGSTVVLMSKKKWQTEPPVGYHSHFAVTDFSEDLTTSIFVEVLGASEFSVSLK